MYRKMKVDHLVTSCTRINSNWIKDLNIRPEIIKIIKENIGSKILDVAHTNILWDISPQAMETKEKINKQDYIKLKNLCTAKEIINKIRQPAEWENIFTNTSDKGLISKIYTELTKLNTKKPPNNPVLKIGKGPVQTGLQRGYTDSQKAYEKMFNVTTQQRNAN